MKRPVLVATLAALSGLIPLGAPTARAQFEVDPDHFDSPNVEPFDKAKTNVRSDVVTMRNDSKFPLAYTLPCNSESLGLDRYSVSLGYPGKFARQAIEMERVAHRQAPRLPNDTLLQELPKTTPGRSVIEGKQLDFVLDVEAKNKELSA